MVTGVADLFSRERATHMLAGATAGICVDVAVYPLDTIKTRLQSVHGRILTPCGQFRLFAGLPAILYGSAPSAAVFFYAYEITKSGSMEHGAPIWLSSMLAAGCGEITSLIIRVPCENVKQNAQSKPFVGVRGITADILHHEGIRGLYRGYVSTVVRELPCSLIQFPIWELLKKALISRHINHYIEEHGAPPPVSQPIGLTKMEFGFCGFVAGAISGALTTPLDVAKTRIMLAERNSILASGSISHSLRLIFQQSGFSGWFAGLLPRMGIMSFGGAIFLGLYDITKEMWFEALRP